jgi:hypothetical protein
LARRRRGPADRGAAGAGAEVLGVDLVTIQEAGANIEPFLADGTKIWSLI